MNDTLKDSLCEILEIDEVKEADVLRDFEMWDSLAGLSVIAMCDAKFGFTLTPENLRAIKTVGELAEHIAANKTK